MEQNLIDFEGLPSLDDIIRRGINATANIISDYLIILLIIAGIYLVLGLIGIFNSRKACSRDYRNLAIGILLLVFILYVANYTGIEVLFLTSRDFGGGRGYY